MTDALSEAQKEAIMARIPTARLGSVDDVGVCALFLASEEAGYVTGQTLHVNGGMAMIYSCSKLSMSTLCGLTEHAKPVKSRLRLIVGPCVRED